MISPDYEVGFVVIAPAPLRHQSEGMATGRLIELGGGGAAIGASGTTVPHYGEDDERSAPLTLTQSVSAESERRGSEIIGTVIEAVESAKKSPSDPSWVRLLARLVREYPDVVLRVAEFNEYLDWLVLKRRDEVVARILRDSDRMRGRPMQSYGFLVALVSTIMDREECNAAKAAAIAAQRYGSRIGIGERAIRNACSEYGRLYQLGREGYYIPDDRLTPTPWTRRRHDG